MQELDDIWCYCDWMAPRYTVVPSLAYGMCKYIRSYLFNFPNGQALGSWNIYAQ